MFLCFAATTEKRLGLSSFFKKIYTVLLLLLLRPELLIDEERLDIARRSQFKFDEIVQPSNLNDFKNNKIDSVV